MYTQHSSNKTILNQPLFIFIFLYCCTFSFNSFAQNDTKTDAGEVVLIGQNAVEEYVLEEDVEEEKSAEKTESFEDENGQIKPDLNKFEGLLEDREIGAKDLNRKDKIYQSAVDFAQWVDGFFGEAEELESAGYDFLRLVNTIGWREGEGVKYRPRIKARVNLPRMDKKLSLMFADNNEITNSEFESLQNDDLFNQEHSNSSAAINYESDYYNRSKFDTRIGIDSSFDLFALIKHTYQIYKDEKVIFRNYNYLFWKEKERFGINPRIEMDYITDNKNLFRWKYSVLLSEKSEGNEWRNTFSIVNQFSKESWISYDFDILGASDHSYDVDTYRLGIRYRRQLNIKWLYFEIEPELLWHREPEYIKRKLIPGLIFRLEVQFEH